MSIKSSKKNNHEKEIESLNLNFKYFKIYIQCPFCGDLIKINPEREYECRKCNQTFTESEIRERCGL
ncbi:hypothetical protein LCGC14_1052270 [marine sediment metagenome]|uniref:Uncharacterized protein n=1 Tax=marine sediment metagenome TaxID=412755 RepID=A0A0F9QUK1_9ZZZZ|nr:hypothetical protein [archaeon]